MTSYVVKTDFIKQRRLALSMNQVILADKANISQSYVSGIERGRYRTVGLKTILKLANALNVHYSTLIEATSAIIEPTHLTIPIDNNKTIEVALVIETAPQYDSFRQDIARAIREVISQHENAIIKSSIPLPSNNLMVSDTRESNLSLALN